MTTYDPGTSTPQSRPNRLKFGLTWDYRCPFARNVHEHVLSALEDGAEFDVSFLPFSLSQAHVEEGGVSVFDDPGKRPDLLAIEVGLVVRDRLPRNFYAVHRGLFALRHDEGRDLREEKELRLTLERREVDPDFVFGEISQGWPLETLRNEHEASVRTHSVWGVPTFIVDSRAVFVRVMTRPEGDAKLARRTVEQVVELLDALPELNEFKYTTIPN